MADASRTVDIIFRGQNQLGAGIDSVEQSLGGIGEEASEAEGKVDDLGGQVEALGDKPRAGAERLTAALKALAASLILKDFIDANVQFETFERTMTLIKGSAEDAGAEFAYLTQLSNTLGLEVLSTAKNYADLSAATRGTNLEGQQTREIFEAVSIAMSALGKSSVDTEGALTAITQIVSKGVVSMEELRQQLGERVPSAFQTAADAMGLTTAELNDLVASGTLTADVFLPKFAAALKETFGDVAYVDTYTASLNRLKNAITDSELIIGAAGGFDVLTKAIQAGTATIVGSIATFGLLGDAVEALYTAFSTGDFSQLGSDLDSALSKAADKTRGARDALLGLSDVAQEVKKSTSDMLQPIEAQGAYIIYNLDQWEKYDQAVEKTSTDLEKIASNERIKNMEFKVALDIAEVEANAKKVESAFESINVGIESTGDLLKGLFDNLGEADSFREMFQIEDQIKLENERRTKELELQEKLTKATIAELKARQQMMKSGGALITVNGDGLQPHLEAFMWEILEAIQVRVNADGYEMLLGGP